MVSHENGLENGAACKQRCLNDTRCKSFVTYDSTSDGSSCDMYNATLTEGFAGRGTGNDAGPDHVSSLACRDRDLCTDFKQWFDRACPDLLPVSFLSLTSPLAFPQAQVSSTRNPSPH